jgi:hypothetical protein
LEHTKKLSYWSKYALIYPSRSSKVNLGLGLTGNTNEAKSGGFGDAVPLSHLGGARDIIEFVTFFFFLNYTLFEIDKVRYPSQTIIHFSF